jgi:hypothetical protein
MYFYTKNLYTYKTKHSLAFALDMSLMINRDLEIQPYLHIKVIHTRGELTLVKTAMRPSKRQSPFHNMDLV